MPSEPSLAEVLRKHRAASKEDIHTAIPGKVVAYYPATMTADVLPMVRGVFTNDEGDLEYEDLPVCPHVPVQFPRGGGYILTFPVSAGDPCLLVYTERDAGSWQGSGGLDPTNPTSAVRVGPNSPVALLGVAPDALALTGASAAVAGSQVLLGATSGDAQLHIGASGIKLGASATQYAAIASLVDAAVSAIVSAFNAHVHTSAAAGSPTTTPVPSGPVPIPTQASVAATLVKVQ